MGNHGNRVEILCTDHNKHMHKMRPTYPKNKHTRSSMQYSLRYKSMLGILKLIPAIKNTFPVMFTSTDFNGINP